MKEFYYENDCKRHVHVDLDDTRDVVKAYLRECRAATSDLRVGEPGQDDHVVTLYADGVLVWENFGTVWGGEHMFGHGALSDVDLIAYTFVRNQETTAEIIRRLLYALRERRTTMGQPTTAVPAESRDQRPKDPHYETAWRLQRGWFGGVDLSVARDRLVHAGGLASRLRAVGWDSEGRPNQWVHRTSGGAGID